MSCYSTSDLERKGSGTGVFLPRVSVSRPVKWAAGSEGTLNSLIIPPPPARAISGSEFRHVLIENAPSASASHVLLNLTPVSSPTAGAMHNTANSMSGSQAHSGAMQLSRGAPSEEYSSSWSEHLAAAPEVGGWSIKRAGSVASSSSASQPPRSGPRMMQLLQQHQQLQQQMQQVQPNWSAQAPPPPRQESRSLNRSSSSSSSSTMNAAAGTLAPVPPPPRSRTASAAADNTSWELMIPASATAAAPVPMPASSNYQMEQRYSRLDAPGAVADACGNPYAENQSVAGGSSSNSSRAARAAALTTMMTGSEAQPKFWGLGQLPALNNVRCGTDSFSGGINVCLHEQQQQQQQQQVVQYNHSAPLPGASLGIDQHSQQLQLVQQAAITAGGRVFDDSTQLQQMVCDDQQPDMLLSELDVHLLQLLQLSKQLEFGGSTAYAGAAAAAAAAAVPSLPQGSAYSAAAMPGAQAMLAGGGGFDAHDDTAGTGCMPLPPAMQMPGMPAGEQALLQLPESASTGGDLLQLQMAACIGDSASQLAALRLDTAGQPLQNSDPCLAVYGGVMQNGSYDDQQYVGSGSFLAGQGPVRQARVSEVKEKMRQLADVQTVQSQLQEELLALLQ